MALLIAIAALALSVYNARGIASPRRRATLIALRALALASLVAVLAQPTWVARETRRAGHHVAVVIDRSASMATGPAGQRRFDRALAAGRSIEAGSAVARYYAGERLEAAPWVGGTATPLPDAPASDLLSALGALRDSARHGRFGAAVIVSDGLDTGELSQRNPSATTSLDADSAAAVRALGVPVHAVFIDDPTPPRDLAVTAVRVSRFGFVRAYLPVSVDIELSGVGGEKGSTQIELFDNGRRIATQAVPLAGLARRTLEFELQPTHVGPHVVEAAIAPLPDEVTAANNRAWGAVSVVRDRVRVLHLAGRPSWDTRFLRTHLRASAAVDLVSFYVMVGDNAGAYVAGEDTTLIPFPAKEIFDDALAGFDLFVLQDFPYGPFELDRYLPNVARHLKGGGALLVVGGPLSLAAGGYHATPLAELLPVQLEPPGEDGGWTEGPVVPKLTPLGAAHPLTLLGSHPAASEAAWARHTLAGRNTSVQAREGANVLVTDDAGRALIAVGEVGEGRSAVVATGSLWTWAFGADTVGDGGEVDGEIDARTDYHRLIDQLVAWLLRDPDHDLLRVEAPDRAAPVGVPITLPLRLRDAAGQPQPDIAVRWTAVAPGGIDDRTRADRPGPRTDERGEATLMVAGLAPGAWLVVVEVHWQGRPQRAVVPVVVAANSAEYARVQPSDRLLQLVARASGGAVWPGAPPASGIPGALDDAGERGGRVDATHTELWSRPEVLVWLIAILGAEWTLRRRWGLA